MSLVYEFIDDTSLFQAISQKPTKKKLMQQRVKEFIQKQ